MRVLFGHLWYQGDFTTSKGATTGPTHLTFEGWPASLFAGGECFDVELPREFFGNWSSPMLPIPDSLDIAPEVEI